MCADDGDVTYLLGDMDLLILEEEGANLTYTYEEWEKMVGHDPPGTMGMKPPEVSNKRIQHEYIYSLVLLIHLFSHTTRIFTRVFLFESFIML